MKVQIIATGRDEDCGIATYTTSLEDELDVETERTPVRLRSWNILHYVQKAIEAGREDSDVIHLQHEYGIFGPKSAASWVFLPIIHLIAAIRGIPIVVTLHTAWNEETIDTPLFALKSLYVHLNNRLIAAIADHLIFLSENAREKFEADIVHPSVTVMPHGVQTDVRDIPDAKDWFGYEENDALVVEPGYVRPQKGYKTLLTVAEALPEVKFLIAGGTQDESHEAYAQHIQEESPPNVSMTGVLDDDLFHAAFAAADLVFLPYESVTQSGILNWCIAYKCPVLASDKAYFRNIAGECEGVQVFGTVEKAISAVRSISTDTDKRAMMAQGMCDYGKTNSMAEVANEHQEIYKHL